MQNYRKKGRYVMRSKEKGKILNLSTITTGLSILLICFLASGTAYADPMVSLTLVHNDQQFKVKSETIRVVTAYNVGDPRQTDDTPCISANGENICRALAQGEMRCAANFVPLGSHLYVDKIGVCLVTDRMNRRYRNRVDIAMQKDEYRKARRFGKQKLHVKILDDKLMKN
jgi:3D (Asp-Asp-Asp) domain-containing protein